MIMALDPFSILRNAANDLLSAANSLEGTSHSQNARQQGTQVGQQQQPRSNHATQSQSAAERPETTREPVSRPLGRGQPPTSSTASEFYQLFNSQVPGTNRGSDSKCGNGRNGKRKRTQSDRKKRMWSHKFVCLANKRSETVPTMQQKCVLAETGLGEKDVEFDSDGDSANVHEKLLQTFPALKNAGGFEILRTAERSNITLVVVPAPRVGGYTVAYLRSVLNQAKGYIRPMQQDLKPDLTQLNETSAKGGNIPTEKCLSCGLDVQFHVLREHIQQCNTSRRNDSVSVPHGTAPEQGQSSQEHQQQQSTAVQQQGYNNYISLISDESDTSSDGGPEGDAEFQAAIAASLADIEQILSDENLDEYAAIQMFQAENLDSSAETPSQILINRKSIFKTTMRAIQRKNFSFLKPVVVTFADEAGIDVGGPKREFFRLLMQSIRDSSIFSGSWFSHDLGQLNDGRYRLAGKLVAWSALQGGGGPRCLSEVGYHLGKGKSIKNATAIEAVDDSDLKSLLKALEGCTSDTDFEDLLQHHADTIAQFGYCQIYNSKVTDKDNVIHCLAKQHFLYSVMAEITQFFDGMNEIGKFGELAKSNESIFASFLSNKVKKLTRDEFKSAYKVCYSEERSNDKTREDNTIYCFELFLQDLEEGEADGLSLEDMLIFITCSDHIPPLGFGQLIRIIFYNFEGSAKRRPWSSTCALTLNLPRGVEDPSDFNILIKQSLMDCHGFGQV